VTRNFDIRNLVPVDGDEGSASSDQIPISSPYFPSFSHPLLIFLFHLPVFPSSFFDLVFSEAPFIPSPEMDFLDNNLTKDLSILLHAIHSPFYWQILKKTRLFCAFFKILTKKTAKQEN
jgi:hypothetical protein